MEAYCTLVVVVVVVSAGFVLHYAHSLIFMLFMGCCCILNRSFADKDFYFNNYTEKRSYYIKANRVRVTLCRRQYLIKDAKHIFIF